MTSETAQVRNVIITRSHEGNLELAAKLRAMGLEPIPLDILSFSPPEDWSRVDPRLRSIKSYDWLLFTSATGARFFVERMRTLSLPLGWDSSLRVGAVGERTARVLTDNGVRVDFTPTRFLTHALAEELPGKNGTVLLLRANIADPAMRDTLHKRGFKVDEVAIYETRHLQVAARKSVAEADLVIFGSPSAVEGLCAQLPDGIISKLREKVAACIGPVTASAARAHGFTRIIESERHAFDSLLDEVRRLH